MLLEIVRFHFDPKYTVGRLYINSNYFCYTLEDTVRAEGVKIKGQTAIPQGRYKVIVDYSNRFQRELPHILDVKGFEGIRIHSGNTDQDTEGCILLGESWNGSDFVGNSRVTFSKFYDLLKKTRQADLSIK